jgi:hypothetical protein
MRNFFSPSSRHYLKYGNCFFRVRRKLTNKWLKFILKLMNNFIIAWPPLSWKSTLGRELGKTIGASHIPTDPLVSAISEYFPSSSIGHWGISSVELWKSSSSEFTQFLNIYLWWYKNQDSCNPIILEWFHINFEELIRKYKSKSEILVIGYPDISIEQKMIYTRDIDIQNWTISKDDKYLADSIWFFIELSKYFRDRCKCLWIPFINTSWNFMDTIRATVDNYSYKNINTKKD